MTGQTLVRRDAAFAPLVLWMARVRSTILFPLISELDDRLGWRVTLRWLALLTLVATGGLHAFVLRERPSLELGVDGAGVGHVAIESVEQSMSLVEARRTSVFWRMTTVFGIARFIAAGISAHLFPLLIEQGKGPSFAAVVAGAVGPMQVLGRAIFLPVSRQVSLRTLSMINMVIFACVFVSLAVSSTNIAIGMFIVLFGIANGAATMSRAGLTSERFGSAFMSVLAPIALGQGRTWFGNYVWALLGLAIVAIIGALTINGIGEPHLTRS